MTPMPTADRVARTAATVLHQFWLRGRPESPMATSTRHPRGIAPIPQLVRITRVARLLPTTHRRRITGALVITQAPMFRSCQAAATGIPVRPPFRDRRDPRGLHLGACVRRAALEAPEFPRPACRRCARIRGDPPVADTGRAAVVRFHRPATQWSTLTDHRPLPMAADPPPWIASAEAVGGEARMLNAPR